jgi:hypothetical protein
VYSITFIDLCIYRFIERVREADLVVVNDLSDMLLDLVCHYFIEDFCIDVHLGNWPIVLLFGGVSVWFWDECNTGFIE